MTRALLLGRRRLARRDRQEPARGLLHVLGDPVALVLGFTLSGAVQAFVSREAMQAKLGDHGPAAVARASGYGMASSSCSYAASAMAKSLFVKGADFVAARCSWSPRPTSSSSWASCSSC